MSEVVMIIGPTGTGKSTVSQKFLTQPGYVRLNRDTEGGGTLDLLPKMEQLMADGKNIVLDNTHLTPDKRVPFVQAAKAVGCAVTCYVMDTEPADAQVNLVTRMIQMGIDPMDLDAIKASDSPNVFPSAVHFKHYKTFEEPTSDEGFDTIVHMPFKRVIDPTYTNKALILDYDETLRTSTGEKKFPLHPDEVKLLPGRTEVLKKYEDAGYRLLGASNQSAVGKGDFTYQEACACFDRTNDMLGVQIEYAFCPHKSGPIFCWCRKPMPGIAIMFIEKYKLDREQTIMVGDMTSDKTFATRAGIQYMDAEDFFGG